MRQWSVWRIACALGELHGTDALDDESVVALLFLAELIDLTDRQATYSIACGVVVGAGISQLDRYHAHDPKPPRKRKKRRRIG
jgi:hypothetical protein